MRNISDYDFDFPKRLIADYPLERGESRLIVVPKCGTDISESVMDKTSNLHNYLCAGDVVVLNNTKVIQARLEGFNNRWSRMDILLLNPLPGNTRQWEALVKPGKRFRKNTQIKFSDDLTAQVVENLPEGHRVIEFEYDYANLLAKLEIHGRMPLPPYIKRECEIDDIINYQSIFAKNPGSVAAPTASLHLSQRGLDALRQKGIILTEVTLHVGAGTFQPVRCENVDEHIMHGEYYSIDKASCDVINAAKKGGNKIIAVGTTVARVLETVSIDTGYVRAHEGMTHKFILPGYKWKTVDNLLTNFHWPKSTLFMLVCSLLSTERARLVYEFAFQNEFRLFSYGDAMLIK